MQDSRVIGGGPCVMNPRLGASALHNKTSAEHCGLAEIFKAKKSRLAYLALEIVCNWCGVSVNFEPHWGLEVMRKRKVYASAFTRIQVELVVRPVHNWPAALLSRA